jgi:catechol 2,3-dioxygenase-like lactoylglutathione lyase family enzyme
MSDASHHIDFENLPTPSEGILVTLFLTVRDAAACCDFYSRALGGTVVLEGTPSIIGASGKSVGLRVEVEAAAVEVDGGLEVVPVAVAACRDADGLDA